VETPVIETTQPEVPVVKTPTLDTPAEAVAKEYVTNEDTTYVAVQSTTESIVELTTEETESREFLKNVVLKTVQQNDSIAAAWLCWEPRTFNVQSTDRFSINFKRSTGSSIAAGAYPNPDSSKAYYEAMKGQTVVSEPYQQGSDSVVSISAPIQYRAKPLGVCGVDVSTEALSLALRQAIEANPMLRKDAKAYLVSPQGLIVASSDSSNNLVGRKVQVNNRMETSLTSRFTLLGRSWQVQLVVPKSVIEEPVQSFRTAIAAQRQLVQGLEYR
jgi:hypothetical protein